MKADDLIQFDLAVLKAFKLGEARSLEFRGEFFNLFNPPTLNVCAKRSSSFLRSFAK